MLFRLDNPCAVDQHADEQGPGCVSKVDDQPKAPALPAEVSGPAKEHLRQEDIDLREQRRSREDDECEPRCEPKSEEQPGEPLLLDADCEKNREYGAKRDEGAARECQSGLLERGSGEQLLSVFDEAQDDFLRKTPDVPARFNPNTAARTIGRFTPERISAVFAIPSAM